MSVRQGIRTVNSDEVQGEGSWVKLDPLTVKEVREMRKQADADGYDNFEAALGIIKKHVIGWNWVDYDGEALPTPASYPSIVDTLTITETNFLASALLGDDAESKNS